MLEVGSVAGVTFSAAAVAAGFDDDVMQIDERCAAVERRSQWLRSCGEQVWPDGTVAGGYSFVHALYQEVVYSRLTVARKVVPPPEDRDAGGGGLWTTDGRGRRRAGHAL